MTFSKSSVLVLDQNGAVLKFDTNQSSPIKIQIPAGAKGVWTWVISRAGYDPIIQAFSVDDGGYFKNTVTQNQRVQPSGAAMFTNSVDGNVFVKFDISDPAQPRCYIDVADAPVKAQAVLDEIETALETEEGCLFLALTGGSQVSYAGLPGGNYLFLGTGYRIRRAKTEDANASVGAFVISSDGVVVDNVNGSVSFLSAPSSHELALAVWSVLSSNTLEGSFGEILASLANSAAKSVP